MLAVLSFQATAATVFDRVDPKSRGWLIGSDLRAAVNLIDVSLILEKRAPTKAEIETIRRHIARQPLDASAIRLIGLAAEDAKDAQTATAAYKLAERMSRRELYVQILLARAALLRDDPTEAFGHLDIAMRTKPETAKFIYTVLSQTLTRQEVRDALLPIMAANPDWLPGFLASSIDAGGDPMPIVELVEDSQALRKKRLADAVAAPLLTRLAAVGEPQAAVRIARQVAPDPSAFGRSLKLDATGTSALLGTWAWTLGSSPDGAAGFVADGQSRGIRGYVSEGKSFVFATRALALPAGRYRLGLKVEGAGPEGATIIARVYCGMQATAPAWASGNLVQDEAVEMTVPRDCPLQRFEMVSAAPEGSEDFEFFVRDIGNPSRVN